MMLLKCLDYGIDNGGRQAKRHGEDAPETGTTFEAYVSNFARDPGRFSNFKFYLAI